MFTKVTMQWDKALHFEPTTEETIPEKELNSHSVCFTEEDPVLDDLIHFFQKQGLFLPFYVLN